MCIYIYIYICIIVPPYFGEKAARRPTAISRHSTSERRVLRDSPLCCGPRPSRCVHSVALGSAQSCTVAHNRIASLHVGASRLAQLAAALWDLAVPYVQSLLCHRSPPHVGPHDSVTNNTKIINIEPISGQSARLTSSRALCSAMSCSPAPWTPRAAGSRERADGASRASSTAPYGPQPQLAVARHTKSRAPNAASCCFAVWSPRAARGKAARRAAVVDQPQSAAVRHSLRAARCNQLPCVTH